MKLPQIQLCKIQRMIHAFIWQGKRPRIKSTILQMPIRLRGLAVPDIMLYHHAALLEWCSTDNNSVLQVEQAGVLVSISETMLRDPES